SLGISTSLENDAVPGAFWSQSDRHPLGQCPCSCQRSAFDHVPDQTQKLPHSSGPKGGDNAVSSAMAVSYHGQHGGASALFGHFPQPMMRINLRWRFYLRQNSAFCITDREYASPGVCTPATIRTKSLA